MVLIAQQGQVLYEQSFGHAHYETNSPFKHDSLTNIASVSKTFTAVAVMQLVEQQRLKLSDELQQYLPELPYPGVTIKHMLSHTSGLYGEQKPLIRQAINNQAFDNKQIKAVYARIKPPLNFVPGSQYNYSNANYTFLALIIEQVSGQQFPAYLQQHVFKPAGMHDSYVGLKRVPETKRSNVMSYYRKPHWLNNEFSNIQQLPVNQSEHQTFRNKYGASQIHTTSRDLFKYHQALQSGQLLQPDTLAQMYQVVELSTGQDYNVSKRSNYAAKAALGWRVAEDHTAGRIVFHAGGFRGGRSLLIRNLDIDQVIIILSNNTETDHLSFSFAMRALNQQTYQLDPISLPRLFANQYLKHGIKAAVTSYRQHQAAAGYRPFVDWDFEEIGEELLQKQDFDAAVALFKLYTEQFPADPYAWAYLGQALHLTGQLDAAIKAYRRAQIMQPDDDSISQKLQSLLSKSSP